MLLLLRELSRRTVLVLSSSSTTLCIGGLGVWWYKSDFPVVIASQIEELPSIDPNSIESLIGADKEHSWEKITARSATTVSSSVCGLVEVTATRWIECESLYHKYLQTLIDLLREYIKAIGTPGDEELWDTVMFLRGFLAEIKDNRRKLSLLWTNCQGLAEHAGQAAYQTGTEFSACRLGEVVTAAEFKMSSLSRLTADLEVQLAQVETAEIRKSMEHEKRKSKSAEPIDVTKEETDN